MRASAGDRVRLAVGGMFVAAVLFALILSGCGSSDSTTTSFDSNGFSPSGAPGVGGPVGETGFDPQAIRRFSNCLQEHGAELPDLGDGGTPGAGPPPTGGPGSTGGLDAKTRKAMRACSSYLPQPPSGAPGQLPQGASPQTPPS